METTAQSSAMAIWPSHMRGWHLPADLEHFVTRF
jgi:hypothetical protein